MSATSRIGSPGKIESEIKQINCTEIKENLPFDDWGNNINLGCGMSDAKKEALKLALLIHGGI